ncbi:MAG TPA: leucine--tRNA ligase [Candidatus Eremiobacteraeota bacterium]|nr:MAG: Leucine--tRNA ligase [bacterium ADurb.Bin363]HPZ08038.1 leucine--tRNA ligase [Candidatus Eremiobacteraeota bacterium]
MTEYNTKKIEEKWKKKWEEWKLYEVDVEKIEEDKKCYCLVMFSYPSGDKLHVGHWFNFGPTDTWARFKKMQGYQVFEPMGFDAFGLPAENYAVKTKVHPRISTINNIEFMRKQLREIGAMYDWRYEVVTCEPEYYKWTQWVFLQLYKRGLAYKAEAPVNWCPECNTVLANEQVQDGNCDRCHTEVTKKSLNQWFFRITGYAEKLLEGLQHIDWPEKTKIMQTNWIGRSEGTEVYFNIAESNKTFTVFTTRPDTLYGATYVVFAPEHPLVSEITTVDRKEEVKKYIENTLKIKEIDRTSTIKEKTGVFTGAYAINPINGEKIPVWIADYVLYSYGTGAVMAVPAHDERDFEFAKKYNLPVREVILKPGKNKETPLEKPYADAGIMVNSAHFNGLSSDRGIDKITKELEEKAKGKPKINYRLRDWLISRQRYWGAPIPVIYCPDCGEVPVPEEELPVLLPDNVDFSPTGESPLKKCKEFLNTTCPKCRKGATREVDTMDTFVCSSWYFLRYPCAQNSRVPFEKELINKMLPVDKYVGGPEHTCMHLLYARFITMALHDMGYINFTEPFSSLTHQGMILGPDHFRMSKSRGNVISPESYIEKYGSDIFRCYLMFGFAYTEGGAWEDAAIVAIDRFLKRFWKIVNNYTELFQKDEEKRELTEEDKNLNRVRHNSIKGITYDIERFQFNTSISRIMELVNELYKYSEIPQEKQNNGLIKEIIEDLIRLFAPMAPHFTEELWEKTGHKKSIFLETWPTYDPLALAREMINIAVQINGKLRAQMEIPVSITDKELQAEVLKYGRIPKLLEGKNIKKIIIVKRKLVNIVVT